MPTEPIPSDPTPVDEASQLAAAFAVALAAINESMAPVREATTGYRAALIAGGMDDLAANQCAQEYHSLLIDMVRKSLTRTGMT